MKSNNADFPSVRLSPTAFGWTEYVVCDGKGVTKVPKDIIKLSYSGVLGMPGATVYYGFYY